VSHIGEQATCEQHTGALLKRLEQTGLVQRLRSSEDERVVNISLTPAGRALKQKCACIPTQLLERMGYSSQDALKLKKQLDSLLAHLQAAAD
jgi:DNA-binding MarR family transcriptional regulator